QRFVHANFIRAGTCARDRLLGWGARTRTWEWRNQSPLPYHLATPQHGTMPAGFQHGLPAVRRTDLSDRVARNQCTIGRECRRASSISAMDFAISWAGL